MDELDPQLVRWFAAAERSLTDADFAARIANAVAGGWHSARPGAFTPSSGTASGTHCSCRCGRALHSPVSSRRPPSPSHSDWCCKAESRTLAMSADRGSKRQFKSAVPGSGSDT